MCFLCAVPCIWMAWSMAKGHRRDEHLSADGSNDPVASGSVAARR